MSGPSVTLDAGRAYRVIGFLTGEFGLGVAARNSVRALIESGRKVEGVTIQNRWSPGAAAPPPGAPAPDEVALFQLNPNDIASYGAAWGMDVAPGSPRVCVPFWELPRVPTVWEPVLRALDAVLAPTRFVQEACARVMEPGRVLHYPQAAFHPAAVPARDAWGFEPGATVFLASFDIGSDIDRKNPWAAIDAFRAAFPSAPDVRLVIKTKPWKAVPEFKAQMRELSAHVSGDARIRVLERTLDYADLMSLYASCDVMLALHRSEGLGLHLMEAMSLGRTVVATGWSGNADFMTPENSVPIRYRLVPIRTRHSAYQLEIGRDGQVWAEVELAHAVEALRALHASPERRRALGAGAAAEMEERRERLLSGVTFDALEATLPRRARSSAAFRAALLRTRVGLLLGAAARAPAFLARRVGLTR